MKPFVELFNPLGPSPMNYHKSSESTGKKFVIEDGSTWKIEIEIVDGKPKFIRGMNGWGDPYKPEDISIRESDE